MDFGTIDFVQYWSAFQLLRNGLDPYDPQLTLAAQCSVGLHCAYPRTTYTPPWLWLLMSPVLMQPFLTAAALWSKVSVGLALTAGVVVAAVQRLKLLGALFTSAAAVMSFPFLIDLLFGQLSGLLLLGVSLLYAGLVRRIPPLSAAGLVLLTAKPHLFAPLVSAVLVSEIGGRRLKTAIWTTGYLCGLIAIAELLSPGASRSWVEHLLFPDTTVGVKAVTFWATDAPASALARMLHQGTSTPPRWPLILLASVGLVVGLTSGRRLQTGAGWQSSYPMLVWIGFASAPFAWFSDYAVLTFLQAVTIAKACMRGDVLRASVVLVAGMILHVGVARLEQAQVPHFGLDEMFWFPGALLMLYVVAHSQARPWRSRQASPSN